MTSPVRASAVIVALATGGFAIGTTEFATMSLIPLIRETFGLSAATASHVISAYALGVCVGAPLITTLASGIDRKTLLIVLIGLFAAGNAASGLAPTYEALIAIRFATGLPHGAYFGLAALLAASVVAPGRRTQAVGYVMLGLTLATVVGVPLATALGQLLGWRSAYAVIAVIALLAAILIARFAPAEQAPRKADPLRELSALRKTSVWLTLAIGAIGFGGLFGVYTYLTTTLDEVTGTPAALAPFVLATFGIGMTIGNLVAPRFADRALMPTAGVLLVWSAVSLALFVPASGSTAAVTAVVFCIGFGGALATVLQTRLMDVAGEAQNLAAALNHVAFNLANALGPWLAGMALAAGYGLPVTGWVGFGLALAGLVIWAIAWIHEARHPQVRRGD